MPTKSAISACAFLPGIHIFHSQIKSFSCWTLSFLPCCVSGWDHEKAVKAIASERLLMTFKGSSGLGFSVCLFVFLCLQGVL